MPTVAQVHNDTFLTNALIGAKNDAYIADLVAPPLFTAKESGKIAGFGRDHFRLDFSARAMGAGASRVEYSPTSNQYAAEEFRLEFPVDDRLRAQYDMPYDAFRDAALQLNEKIMLKKESLIASLLQTTGNYSLSNTDATSRDWDTTGDPAKNVQQVAIASIVGLTGASMNSFYGACGFGAWNKLITNAKIREVFASTAPGASGVGVLTTQSVAGAMGLQDIYVGSAVQNTAAEGAAEVMSPVWNANDFVVFSKAPGAGFMAPGFAFQIFPTVDGFAGAQVSVDRYRDETISSDVVRAKVLLDQVMTEQRFGYLFQNVL